MFHDIITLSDSRPFDRCKLLLDDSQEIFKEDYGMLNDFPSVWELDPNEVIQKKCNREDAIEKTLGSSFFKDKIFEEDGSTYSQLFLSTQEVSEELQTQGTPKNWRKEVSEKTKLIKPVKLTKLSKEDIKNKEKSNKRSKKAKITQKVRSFDNRKRFGK